jgi:hypothetical protein
LPCGAVALKTRTEGRCQDCKLLPRTVEVEDAEDHGKDQAQRNEQVSPGSAACKWHADSGNGKGELENSYRRPEEASATWIGIGIEAGKRLD